MKKKYHGLMFVVPALMVAGAQTSFASALVSIGDNTDVFSTDLLILSRPRMYARTQLVKRMT